MDLVIDSNVIFSALISPKGKTRDLLFSENLQLFAPEFLFEEFNKYRKEIIDKSGLTKKDLETAFSIISRRVLFVPFSRFKSYIHIALKISPDPNDTEFFALAISKGIPLWSNDKALKKQASVKIFSTSDLIEYYKI